MTTAILPINQSPSSTRVVVVEAERPLAMRVSVLALGILSSAFILATVPEPTSILLVMGISIAALAYATGPSRETTIEGYDNNSAVDVVRHRRIRYVDHIVPDPICRHVIVGSQSVPFFIPDTVRVERRHVVPTPDPRERVPVGMTRDTSSNDDRSDMAHIEMPRRSNDLQSHGSSVRDAVEREPVGVRRRG